ncbi:MAG: hypothetical protein ACRCXT_18200, partial [Paraclostridium sp.]
INKKPLSVSYYLDIINRNYNFKYTYINQDSDIQFISNYLECRKNYLIDNKYRFRMNITQNINTEKYLVDTDDYGNIISSKIKPVIVVNENNFKYYKYGTVVEYDKSSFSYTVEFDLQPNGIIDKNNKIKIKDLIPQGATEPTDIYLSDSIDISVYVYIDSDIESRALNQNDIIIPENNMILVNRYDSFEKISLFYNYSNIINSKVILELKDDGYNFKIKGTPVTRYSYLNDIDRCNELIDYIQFRKAYIDNALNVLEDSFNIDLKFFNTYGPSKMFKIGYEGEYLDKVNLTLNFKLKLLVGADKYTKDYITNEIRLYIENINNISDMHMSNLITHLSNKFKNSIEFIEFYGINDYNSTYQYIKKDYTDIIEDVPEFVNINLTKDLKPDINITLV